MEQQGPWGERREMRQAFEEEGAAAMPKVCQLLLALAPMAQTAPGQSLATLVLCQRRREAEQQVCVEPVKFYWPSCFCLMYFYISISTFSLMFQFMSEEMKNVFFIVSLHPTID